MRALLPEVMAYVGLGAEEERLLERLRPALAPHFPAVADAFCAGILAHPEARRLVELGGGRVERLKATLTRWLDDVFAGPRDDAWAERRARIGRVHVRIGLPQHLMVTAMNGVRRELEQRVPPGPDAERARQAVGQALDVDLALMLHAYREDSDARAARAERLATYGQLVGSIAHELRNPLGVIETSLYVLRGRAGPEDPKVPRHLDRIAQQVTLANDIITQLLELIRDRPLARQRVELGALAIEAAQPVARPPGVALELSGLDASLPVDGDATQLRQVVSNLVENAVYAAAPAGRVRVQAAREGGEVRLWVEDTGPGIDAAVMARLFEPLVTTKPKGIGLGLALVRHMVERHGGSVAAERSELGGARFTVRLPEGAA